MSQFVCMKFSFMEGQPRIHKIQCASTFEIKISSMHPANQLGEDGNVIKERGIGKDWVAIIAKHGLAAQYEAVNMFICINGMREQQLSCRIHAGVRRTVVYHRSPSDNNVMLARGYSHIYHKCTWEKIIGRPYWTIIISMFI